MLDGTGAALGGIAVDDGAVLLDAGGTLVSSPSRVVTDGTAVGAWDGVGEAKSTKPVDEVGIKPGAAVLVNTGVLWRLGTIGREGVPL